MSLLRRPSKKEVFNSYYFDENQVRAPNRLSSMVKTKQMDDSPLFTLSFTSAYNILTQKDIILFSEYKDDQFGDVIGEA